MSNTHGDPIKLPATLATGDAIRGTLVRARHNADRMRGRIDRHINHMRLLRHRPEHQMLITIVVGSGKLLTTASNAVGVFLAVVADSSEHRVQWQARVLVLGRDIVRDRLGLRESVSWLSKHALCSMGVC